MSTTNTILIVLVAGGVLWWLDRQAQLAAQTLTPAAQVGGLANALNSTANTVSGIVGSAYNNYRPGPGAGTAGNPVPGQGL